jgi:mannose/fructose/N-acetylgalactosamine-specific phosphotransferase system component IIC
VIALATFGAICSPTLHLARLIITYLLILFGLVLAAYSLDALASDWKHLIKEIPKWQLETLAIAGIIMFLVVASWATITTSWSGLLVTFILIISVFCYNLERPKWFHNIWGFAVTWGALVPVLSYYYQSLQLSFILIPLAITGFLIAMEEWYCTNTHSPMQQAIGTILKENPERRALRKETFRVTSLMCYSLFSLSMTLLLWRIT